METYYKKYSVCFESFSANNNIVKFLRVPRWEIIFAVFDIYLQEKIIISKNRKDQEIKKVVVYKRKNGSNYKV